MDVSALRIGIIHSLIGKNDGVSIVIDQTVTAMVEHMQVPLGNIFFLSAHAPSRFNTTLDEVLWHKSREAKYILNHFGSPAPKDLAAFIRRHAGRAQQTIARFVEENDLDLLIAHNTSHVYNFIAAVGLGRYLESRRRLGMVAPRCLLWWHDSYFERQGFSRPNSVIRSFLKYVPGALNDGIVFLNSQQPDHARAYLKARKFPGLERFMENKTAIIPNTCDITWNWKRGKSRSRRLIHPPQDDYNSTIFKDLGLTQALKAKGYKLKDAVMLLQHTRIVPRKRIEVAIEFAFRIAERYRRSGQRKCIVLLVSGHSGDEQEAYRQKLERHYHRTAGRHPGLDVLFVLGEHIIFPSREVIVDRKFYRFADIPAVVAACGGMGTYFSEVEGFGNNLLEMISAGLPVVIHNYGVFESDLKQFGFKLPATSTWELPDKLIEQCFRLLTDHRIRNRSVLHNLKALDEQLSHRVISDKLEPLIQNIFKYR